MNYWPPPNPQLKPPGRPTKVCRACGGPYYAGYGPDQTPDFPCPRNIDPLVAERIKKLGDALLAAPIATLMPERTAYFEACDASHDWEWAH